MKTCENCKFWEEDENPEFGCEKSICGKCSNKKLVWLKDWILCPTDGLGYWDGELYSAGLEIGPKFGCIHWKKKLTIMEKVNKILKK